MDAPGPVVDLDSDFWLAVADRCELGDVRSALSGPAGEDTRPAGLTADRRADPVDADLWTLAPNPEE